MAKILYAAYFSGATGISMALFLIGDGVIAGADMGGGLYDGSLHVAADGGLEGIVNFSFPAGVRTITGVISDTAQTIPVPIKLPRGFDVEARVTRIETPAGPINARFERLRELPQ